MSPVAAHAFRMRHPLASKDAAWILTGSAGTHHGASNHDRLPGELVVNWDERVMRWKGARRALYAKTSAPDSPRFPSPQHTHLAMDKQRPRAAIDDMFLHLRWALVIGRGRHAQSCRVAARALAMLCDTSYTTCMSRSSGVLLNILANA